MQRNTCYCTVITANHMFSNCVFSERTCVVISVGQCWWRDLFRSKIVDQCKEILGILQLSLLLTCFAIVYFQRVPVCSSLSDNVDEDMTQKQDCWQMQKNAYYYTVTLATYIFFNCVFSERACVSTLYDIVDEEIDSELTLLTNAKKYLVLYSYHCYLHVFQLFIFKAYVLAHLCWTMLMKKSIQK